MTITQGGDAASERRYYAVIFKLDESESYAIWYSADNDGVLLTDSGHIATFPDQRSADAHADGLGQNLIEAAPAIYDFDHLAAWISAPLAASIDCVEMLSAWNMLADIANTVGRKLTEPKGADVVYEKLLWGNNFEAITPKGQHYIPTWTKAEVAALAKLLSTGMDTLRRSIPGARSDETK